ncbi:glutamyl-tRNA synthetase related protein [Janthinobacterium sp. Marseille]|uniref:Glutamyl-Q tRNA(Asp) synthetase n=1 Tax=Janthinobacterium sp. (strain Marseille) TaxID=375286 RepID=GLUQ_JANMA|nr:tRNA glutamyl-Q(34) synthetase GluQRS [Janthinobacterium sp. Marseille]A6SVC2.1 RecName: Full=Glutamyl-Q tRNA(Asp) synthetase; Short=Glu-Q-RSs [Janthinobacterium sp. Marseille]ABR88904.1 glutamyl-tRNA synthetase related protein [Janthinobacterium sp. Marseille]
MTNKYIGRFAPSPSGPLHAGSLVAAMASYLDAKAHQGQWLVRIEDIDETRTVADATTAIMDALAVFGMQHDGEVVVQSQRKDLYQAAFERLKDLVYPCGCTRREIADSRLGVAADGAAIYPGTCRHGLAAGKTARTWRVRVPDANENNEAINFDDRWLGPLTQHLASEVGDFVLKRADGFWAYQLAVVVDDADQEVTHIVRGTDLLESTGRQIYLQRMLGFPTPHYMHVPVVLNDVGEKLSKQTGALALDLAHPMDELMKAARFLELSLPPVNSITEFWRVAIAAWARRFAQE